MGGALLVTLIYLEFKAHLTSMAITAVHHPIWLGLTQLECEHMIRAAESIQGCWCFVDSVAMFGHAGQ